VVTVGAVVGAAILKFQTLAPSNLFAETPSTQYIQVKSLTKLDCLAPGNFVKTEVFELGLNVYTLVCVSTIGMIFPLVCWKLANVSGHSPELNAIEDALLWPYRRFKVYCGEIIIFRPSINASRLEIRVIPIADTGVNKGERFLYNPVQKFVYIEPSFLEVMLNVSHIW